MKSIVKHFSLKINISHCSYRLLLFRLFLSPNRDELFNIYLRFLSLISSVMYFPSGGRQTLQFKIKFSSCRILAWDQCIWTPSSEPNTDGKDLTEQIKSVNEMWAWDGILLKYVQQIWRTKLPALKPIFIFFHNICADTVVVTI